MKQNKKIKQEWKPFLHLLKVSRLPWGWFLFNLIFTLVISTIMMQMPQVAGQIMAGEIFDAGLVVTYVVVTLASAVISIPISLLASWLSIQTDRQLRKTIWKKMVHLPMTELDKVPPTSLISRITSDVSQVSYGISYCFQLIMTLYSTVMILVIIGGINLNMLLMMFVLVPFIILANIPSHFMHDAKVQTQAALSRYTNFLAEHLSSLRQIKAFAAEEKEDERNDAASKAYFRANVRMAKLELIAQPLTYSMDAVVQAIILIYGGYLLSKGELTSENIVSLFMYADTIAVNAYQFVFCWQALKTAQGMTREVSKIVECDEEKMEREKSFAVPDADIRFENVSFSYEGNQKVLNHLNLVIPQGKVTAIAGPSGSGKTTVLKLLERLYEPDEGTIWFGDAKAESIHLNEWRASFGMVPQDSPLLFGTIEDNITYGMDENEVSGETIQTAVRQANVQEIIDRLPDGLKSDVGDVGSKLSGGEKQRIALARMLMRDPEYLLLDEATSSLDAANERQITGALEKLMAGRTSVVVAHNLRTIEHADHIIFMENGTVQACGTHKQLCEVNEKYRRYVELQQMA